MSKNRADLAGFLDWWEENKTKKTVKIPEGHNAMRILTIHKSKGLQFKVVLMPFLTWTIFDTAKDNVIWSPFEDESTGLSAIIPLTIRKELAKSEFHRTYAEECILAYLDSLNMVYVALTRAEEVFWAFAPYKAERKDRSLNNLEINIQQLLEVSEASQGELDLSAGFDPASRIYELGEWPDYERKEVVVDPLPELRWGYQNWSNLLQVKKYAVDFSEEGMAQRKRRNYGLLVHEILEKAATLGDARDILQSFYFDGRLSEEEREAVESQLDALFGNPVFGSWFTSEGQLLAEQGILLPGGRQKRPDRIILKEKEAILVDFKTGEPYERYEKQVRKYMDLVQKLTAKPVRGYLCYLETGNIVEVEKD
jgi:ATP-dependent exoDNAse (exonuclease V) beta subunit